MQSSCGIMKYFRTILILKLKYRIYFLNIWQLLKNWSQLCILAVHDMIIVLQ